MERISDQDDLALLHKANQTVSQYLARFSGVPVQGSDEEVRGLRQVERALKTVGSLLRRNVQQDPRQEIHRELAAYRENLLRLRQELGLMQDSATERRAGLFAREQHLQAARAWCAAARALR